MSQSQASKLRAFYMAQIQTAQANGASESEIERLKAKYTNAYLASKGIN